MSEADFGLTNKGGHKLADPRFAPRVVTPIDTGVPTSGNPGMGDLKFMPDRAENSTGITSPKATGPIK